MLVLTFPPYKMQSLYHHELVVRASFLVTGISRHGNDSTTWGRKDKGEPTRKQVITLL